MKKTVIIGNIGQDAQVKTTQSGKQLASFTVAVSEKIGQQEQTTWFNCSGWGDRFTGTLVQYLRKGTKVYIEGNYSPRMFQRTDGSMDISHDLMVNHIELLGGQQQQQQPVQPQPQYQQPAPQPQYQQQPAQPQPQFQQPVQPQFQQPAPMSSSEKIQGWQNGTVAAPAGYPVQQPNPGSGHKDDFNNDPPF